MTKTKLTELFRVLKLAVAVSGKFDLYGDTIFLNGTNDIIDEADEGINIPGIHYMISPIIVNETIKYTFNQNLLDVMKLMTEPKGKFDFILESNSEDVYVNENTLGLFKLNESCNQTNIMDKSVEYIIDKYFINPESEVFQFTQKEMDNVKNGFVITVSGGDNLSVRLSKNCFPFMGILKKSVPANFMGEYTFKILDDESALIIIHMKYKSCEAVHVYEFTRF